MRIPPASVCQRFCASPGEALWPQRFPVEALPSVERGEISSRSFAALYQQDPQPAGGAMFKPEWFEHRYDALSRKNLVTVQAVDSAWKTGLQNDRTAIVTVSTDWRTIYVEDLWVGRVDYNGLRNTVIEQYRRYYPRVMYVEEAASGYALINDLRLHSGFGIKGVPPGRDSKVARAEAVTGAIESGRVMFPRDAPWMHDLLAEFLRFPYAKHDDIVDAVVLGVGQLWFEISRRRIEGNLFARNLQAWKSRFH